GIILLAKANTISHTRRYAALPPIALDGVKVTRFQQRGRAHGFLALTLLSGVESEIERLGLIRATRVPIPAAVHSPDARTAARNGTGRYSRHPLVLRARQLAQR